MGASPKLRGILLRAPIRRSIVFWGILLGSPYFGKLPFRCLGLGMRGYMGRL